MDKNKFLIAPALLLAVWQIFGQPVNVSPFPANPTVVYAASPNNNIVVRETSGSAQTNYPLQIGRPFAQGEIANYPQAVVNGNPALTQADVKTRWWPDGSVKHAILSFIIPSIPANGAVTVTFQNQASGNNNPLSKAEMLDPKYNFDAVMELASGSATITASARQMLQNGDYTVWASGPVATAIILTDHSAARKYDIGFDSYKSFRPIFHATFWPGINKVRVRYIGEVANTEALKDVGYALTLRAGQSPSSAVYTKQGITHYANSRWTREFWISGKPAEQQIDHNVDYIAATRAVPNFDSSKTMSESQIASEYSQWLQKPKDLYDDGNLKKYMPGVGQTTAPYIGLMSDWHVRWLINRGDLRLKEQAFMNSDLAAAFPVHYREGKSGRFYDKSKTADALGKPISIVARPSTYLEKPGRATAADLITPVGTITNGGWVRDTSHQFELWFLPYMLTGDYWYLEELQFWSAFNSANWNPDKKGPIGSGSQGIFEQIRGEAWMLRTRAHAAYASVDASPEKKYFTDGMNEAIAIFEGIYDVQNTPLSGAPEWAWARANRAPTTLPLSHMAFLTGGIGAASGVANIVETTKASTVAPSWQWSFWIASVGRAVELGYPADALLARTAPLIINQITDPGYNPYLVSMYGTPVQDASGNWFTSWAAVKAAYLASQQGRTTFDSVGYADPAMSAASYSYNQPNGAAAWNWISGKRLSDPSFNSNPRWAILPRSTQPSQSVCGNNIAELGEQCDGTNLNGQSCQSRGFSGGGALRCSASCAFDTSSCTSTDTTPPTTSIISPTMGATISGTATISATASDNVGVAGVQFKIDGANFGAEDTTAPYAVSWDTAAAANGQHTVAATARDAAGNQATAIAVTAMVNNIASSPVPLVISQVSASKVGWSKVNIVWQTNQPADAWVEYGLTAAYGSSTPSSNGLNTSHQAVLTKLRPGTTYHFRVKSQDASGNSVGFADVIFTTKIRPAKPPKLTGLIATEGSVKLSWQPIDYDLCSAVEIYRSTDGFAQTPAQNKLLVRLSCDTSGHTDNNVIPATIYYYSMFLVDDQNIYSDPLTVQFTTKPASPGGEEGSDENVLDGSDSPSGDGPAGASSDPAATGDTGSESPTSPVPRKRLFKQDGIFYLVKNDVRHGVTNPGILYSYGYNFQDAREADAEDLALPEAPPLPPSEGALVKGKNDPTVYYISRGKRHGFTSERVFRVLGHKLSSVLAVTQPELDSLPSGEPLSDGTQRHLPGTDVLAPDGAVYWLTETHRRPYPSLEIYNTWHRENDFSQVVPANEADLLLPAGEHTPPREK